MWSSRGATRGPIPCSIARSPGLFHQLIRKLTQTTYHDITCSLRAMRRQVAEEVHLYGDLHRFFPLLAYQRGFKVVELPVRQSRHDLKRRPYGPGMYLHRLLDILTVFFLFKFTKKPLRFFGLVGSELFIAGAIIVGYLGLYRLFEFGGIAGRPLLILGALLMMLGAQLFSIGLLGELLIFTHRTSRIIRSMRSWSDPPRDLCRRCLHFSGLITSRHSIRVALGISPRRTGLNGCYSRINSPSKDLSTYSRRSSMPRMLPYRTSAYPLPHEDDSDLPLPGRRNGQSARLLDRDPQVSLDYRGFPAADCPCGYFPVVESPLYTATATLHMENRSPNIVGVPEAFTLAGSNLDQYYQTQINLLKSRSLAARVIQDLGLAQDPRFEAEAEGSSPGSKSRSSRGEIPSSPGSRS